MAVTAVCVHHWLIEAPHGTPMLTGECRLCGERRSFPAFAVEDGVTRDRRMRSQRANVSKKRLAREAL